jgi:formate/nitrite transporter FocA (FNT family)
MYLIPMGWALGANVTLASFLGNLVPVTLGNIVGGAGGVALTYWLAYRPKA